MTLAPGTYNITVKYLGSDAYEAVNATKQFTVSQVEIPEISSTNVDNVTYGRGIDITAIVEGLVDGDVIEVTLTVTDSSTGDDKFTAKYNITNGTVISVPSLDIASYSYAITFYGDSKYSVSSDTGISAVGSFDVLDVADSGITIDIPENSTTPVFTIELPEDATGYLLVDVDGEQYWAEVKDGKASVPITGLAAGDYTANITYTGDENNAGFSITKDFTLPSNLPENALTVPDSAKSDAPTTYSVNLPSDATGYLEVDVDGTKYIAALNNGSASVTIPALSEGNHNVTVKYTGVSQKTSLNVTAPVYKITNNKNVAPLYSATAYYKVLVTRDGKAVGAGESVTIKYNGKTYTVKTAANGYATLKLNTKVKVKKYTITAEYKGVKVTNTVTIKHVIKAYNKKVKKSRKVTKVKVTLKKVNKKYLKKKTVKVKFRGKTYKVKTNKKGVATWKVKKSMLKKLKVGKKYKYKVTYGKDVVTKKLTIRR